MRTFGKIFFTIVFLLLLGFSYSQDKVYVPAYLLEDLRVEDSLVNFYLYSNPNVSLKIVNNALSRLETKVGSDYLRAHLFSQLMKIYCVKEQPLDAVIYGYKALLIYDLYNYSREYYQQVLELSQCYFNSRLYDVYFLKILNNSKNYFTKVQDSLAVLLADSYLKYLSSLRKVNYSELWPQIPFLSPGALDSSVVSKLILAAYYRERGDVELSLLTLKLLENTLPQNELATVRYNLAVLYLSTDSLEQAEDLLKKLRVDYIFQGEDVNLAKVYYLLALVYQKKVAYDKSLYNAKKSVQLAKYLGISKLLSNNYYLISDLYFKLGKPDLAYYSLSKYNSLRDSIFSLTRLHDLMANQMKLSALAKERENYKLRKEKETVQYKNRRQHLIIVFFLVLIFFLFLTFVVVYFLYRQNLVISRRFKFFSHIFNEGILIISDGKVMEFNSVALKMLRYTREELREMPLQKLFNREIVDKILGENETIFLETNVYKKDGAPFIASILVKPYPYQKNKNAKVISLRDISEFRKTQKELFESQQRFKTLLETSPDGVILTDSLGEVVYMSNAAKAIFGTDNIEQSNLNLKQLFKADAVDELLEELREKNENLQRQFRILDSKKRLRYIDCRCVSIRNSKKYIDTLFLIVRDITTTFLAQEALRRSEHKFRGLFNKASDGIIIINEEGFIEDANPKATKICNLTADELGHKKFTELLPLSIRKNFSMQDILKADKTFETVMVKYPDEMIYVQISVSLLSESPKLYLFILRDITELRRSQERMKKYADKLEASNRSKLKLFSIISHDLRGPIGNLKSMIELILQSPESFNQQEMQEILTALKDTSVSTYELLENLLYWSRSQLDQIEYEPSVFSLEQVVDSVLKLFREPAERKSIRIKNLINKPELKVFADQNMVKTILRNLLSNAIKFTPRGGEVTLKYYADEKMVIVAVQDTGVGISQQKLIDIFNNTKFVSTRGTENEKGTGLGLEIVREFVQKNRGKLWIESQLGKGSTFYFSLPKPEK